MLVFYWFAKIRWCGTIKEGRASSDPALSILTTDPLRYQFTRSPLLSLARHDCPHKTSTRKCDEPVVVVNLGLETQFRLIRRIRDRIYE
jgi:hypothetical protein